jgi:hypothetical protein
MMLIFFCIIMFIFFLGVSFFPVRYDDLLLSRTQIDRATLDESIIELLHVVARDILLATGREVSLDDVRESIDEYIEWFLIIGTMTCFLVLGRILEVFDEFSWIACTP